MNPATPYCYRFPHPSLGTDMALFHGDHVLLVMRKKNPFQGHWALPGGFVNGSDDPAACEWSFDAVIRELREETSIALDPESAITGLVQVGAYDRPGRDPRGWTVAIAYVGRLDANEARIEPTAADDAAQAMWFRVYELPNEIAFDHRQIIHDALAALNDHEPNPIKACEWCSYGNPAKDGKHTVSDYTNEAGFTREEPCPSMI